MPFRIPLVSRPSLSNVRLPVLTLHISAAPLLSDTILGDDPTANADATYCTFAPTVNDSNTVDISSSLTCTSTKMRQDTPLEVVVRLFQSLNISFVMFLSMGRLTGMMTRVSRIDRRRGACACF